MSPKFLFSKSTYKAGFAMMLASALLLSLASAVQLNGNGLQAYAQSEEAVITAHIGFATFSYGLLSVSITVENVTPGLDTINIKYYNPDGEFLGESDENLSINNGTGSFHCYCGGVERKYVEDNYSIVVTYGEKTETFLVPPFSSMFPQPPDISVEDLRISSEGKVSTSGHVWGGIANENLTVSVLSADGTAIGSAVTRLGLHAQFWGEVDASGQLQVGNSYKMTLHLEGTDIAEEKTFTFTGTDQVSLKVWAAANLGTSNAAPLEAEVILYDQDRNELQSATSPAEFLVTSGRQYFVEPKDFAGYVFNNWEDTGSAERVRAISITYNTVLNANYRNATDSGKPDFSLEASPASLSIAPGENVNTDLIIRSLNGFSSSISIEVYIGAETSQIVGYGYTNAVNLQADGTAHADISVAANENAVPASYVAHVTARGGSINRYLTIPIEITAKNTQPQQSSVTIKSVDVTNGNSEIYGYYTTLSQNGAVVNSGFTPVTFDLTSGETYEVLVYDYGSYFFNYWVNDGSHARQRTLTADGETLLTAGYGTSPSAEQDFAISAESPMSLQAGTSGTSTVTVTSVNGLNSAVTLSMSSDTPGITGSFDVNPAIPSPNDSAASTLTVSVDQNVPAGSYNLVVTGTTPSGISHSATIALTVSGEQAPPSGESSVTVKSIDSETNSPINGYYTILYDNTGNAIQTGFTPATFDLTSGQQYTVEVQDYGSYYFNYWQDDHSTSRDRTFTAANSAQTLTAVYSTSPNASPPPDDNNEEQPPDQTTGTISVATIDSSGNQIYGYYTTLSQNGNVVQTAFSPAAFSVNAGQTYQVAVADYGQYVFDHWSDGSYDRFHNAEAGDSLIAVYRP